MIKITHLSHGKLTSLDIEDLKRTRTETWVDCLNPSKQDIKALSKATELPEEEFTRALDEDERPGISDYDGYSIITFHAPFYNNKHNFVTVPFNIIIKKNLIIILRNRHIEAVEKLERLDDTKKLEIMRKDITFTLYAILNEVTSHFFKVLAELEEKIDKTEENVFKKPSERTVKSIFSQKKTLIYFYKSLSGNREVITGLEKHILSDIKGRNVRKFHYLYSDIVQLIDMVTTLREILANSLDIYLTSASNNMNVVMKRLTVITSFILLPTLISGIYGMNFKGLPEFELGRAGFLYALSLMFCSVILVYVYFKKMEWL